MIQNSVYKGVLILLMLGIIAVAWQVTSLPKPVLEMPASEPSQPAVIAAKNSAQPVAQAQLPVNPAAPPVLKQSNTPTPTITPKVEKKTIIAPQPTQSKAQSPTPTWSQTPPTASQSSELNESLAPAQTVTSEQKINAQADMIIIISDFDFAPKQASIRVGQTVRWEYPSGSNKHAIGFKNSGPRSPLLIQGDSWQHTFNESGVFEYVDLVFTFMYGKVVVG